MKRRIAFDTETFPIGPQAIVPEMVCASFAARDDSGQIKAFLMTADDPGLEGVFREMLEDTELKIIGQKLCFDMAVVMRRFPQLASLIWKAYADQRCTDTKIREALLYLSRSGAIAYARAPDGTNRKLDYSMEGLAKRRLGIDLKGEKTGGDSWRLSYNLLAGKPLDQWPPEAVQYAIDDATHTLLIYESQEADVRSETGFGSLSVEHFKAASDFALYCNTITGIKPDHAWAAKVREHLDRELAAAKLDKLMSSGILRPDELPRPQLRQWKKVCEVMGWPEGPSNCKPSDGWAAHREKLEAGGIKFTAGKKGSIDQTKLRARIEEVCKRLDRKPKMTDDEENPKVSLESDAIEDLVDHDEVLAQYAHRQSLQKLVTTELACLEWEGAPSVRVHPNFNVLVETGRTSSTGNARGRGSYPARNIQNPHPMARPIFVPDDGMWMWSVDYSSLELVTLAQTCYTLFGRSVLRDLINDGVDLHAYLGARLAFRKHEAFQQEALALGLGADPRQLYEHFKKLKKSPHQEIRDFYAHWRKFAKPTNLGYPGGLGPKKFVSYAKKTYGVICTIDEATEMREIWRAEFPEVKQFHDYVSEQCKDPDNERTWDEEEERWDQPYAYTSKLGMHRAATTFCAAANGLGMQTPGAEGATAAHFEVMRAMYDPASTSVLAKGAEGLAFIHDEILGQSPADPDLADAQVREVARLMEETMQAYCPDVKVRTEGKLMLRWHKEAEPVFDERGRLRPWEPALQSAPLTATAAATAG